MGFNAVWTQLIDMGKDILSSTINAVTGVITAQTGNSFDGTADTDDAEVWQPPGYYGIPAAPTQGQPSCQAVTLKTSDYDVVVATRDTRDAGGYGNLKSGERAILGGFPVPTAFLLKNDGSISAMTTDSNTPAGNSVFRRISPTEDRFESPWGKQWHDTSGFHVRTWHGVKIDAGGLGLPAPFSSLGLNSFCSIQADVITLDAAVLHLGRDAGGSGSVVQAQQLAIALAGLVPALNAIVASFNSFTGTGTFPTVNATLIPAITALSTAIALIPTPHTIANPLGCATLSTLA